MTAPVGGYVTNVLLKIPFRIPQIFLADDPKTLASMKAPEKPSR